MKNYLKKLKIPSRKTLEQGFSLAEVMAATAILAVVITVTISQLNMSSKSASIMASDAEINNISNKIISSIGTPAECSKNFKGNLQDGNYTSIINSNAEILIQKGTTVGTSNGEVQVSDIVTKRISDNEMTLILSFQRKKLGFATFLSNSVTREIPINTGIDAATKKIQYCFANYDLVIKTAIEQACKGTAAHYDSTVNLPYGVCRHRVPAVSCTVPGEFLKMVVADVDPLSPTVGNIKFTCGKILQNCDPGQVIAGFNLDGSVICTHIFKTCAPGSVITKNSAGEHVCSELNCAKPSYAPLTVFTGFDATGAQVCTALTIANYCGSGSYATAIDANGVIVCNPAVIAPKTCDPGQYIRSIDANGNVQCAKLFTFPYTCNAGEAITGVDATGTPICKTIRRPLACGGSPTDPTAHTYAQCVAAAGTVKNPGTSLSHCMFSGNVCPSLWTTCQKFGMQKAATCTDQSNTFYCNSKITSQTINPPSGPNVYTNEIRPSVTCNNWTGAPNTGGVCTSSPQAPTTTDLSQIGCY